MTARSDVRTPPDIGRAARLELTFGVRDRRTVLEQEYAEPPLRVGRCLPDGSGVHLILASSAPGIFGGDAFEQKIRIRTGAVVRLRSQSALQVHPSMAGAPAIMRSRFTVDAGAQLHCTWDPIVPFARSRFSQQFDIDVADQGRLFWSDAMMAGREGRGERWRFDRLDHELKLRSGGRLVYLERYAIGDEARAGDPWAAGDTSYFSTVLRVGFGDDRNIAESLHHALGQRDGVYASADLLDGDVMLVRIAATSGVAFHAARDVLLASLGG